MPKPPASRQSTHSPCNAMQHNRHECDAKSEKPRLRIRRVANRQIPATNAQFRPILHKNAQQPMKKNQKQPKKITNQTKKGGGPPPPPPRSAGPPCPPLPLP